MEPIVEVAEMQAKYKNLVRSKRLTKRSMCELCIPFRDKYELTDKQTLMIARDELTIPEIVGLLYKADE